jgi:4-hydroxy-tetrahydrodipicolinate reductase
MVAAHPRRCGLALALLAAAQALARPSRRAPLQMSIAPSDVVIMMNGLPGKMGYSCAEACIARGMTLADVALTGADFAGQATDSRIPKVDLVAGGSEDAEKRGAALAVQCKKDGKVLVAIDFTAPGAALPNAEYYARHGMNFVMGTTGCDYEAIGKTVTGAKHGAVVAPNMSKQIVAMQSVLEQAAKDFPGAFSGYDLSVIESHQKAKVDTSGTAKAVVASLVELNTGGSVDKAVAAVEKVRNDETSLNGADGKLGKVPAADLPGHAYHTYALTSADGTVTFELRHNVNGRSTYAEGVADACLFLAGKAQAGFPRAKFLGRRRRLFDMIDVLSEWAMS